MKIINCTRGIGTYWKRIVSFTMEETNYHKIARQESGGGECDYTAKILADCALQA